MFFFGRLSRWSLMFGLARLLYREGRKRWGRLDGDERQELRRLVTTSKGQRSRLSAEEQAELRRLVKKGSGKDPLAA